MGARSEDDDYACRVDKHKKAAHAQLDVAVLPRQQRVIARKKNISVWSLRGRIEVDWSNSKDIYVVTEK